MAEIPLIAQASRTLPQPASRSQNRIRRSGVKHV